MKRKREFISDCPDCIQELELVRILRALVYGGRNDEWIKETVLFTALIGWRAGRKRKVGRRGKGG
jgi:hypothetical protein